MYALMKNLWNDESGQGLTEYALVVAAVASMVVALAYLFRDELGNMLSAVGEHVEGKVGEIDGAGAGGGT